MQNLGAMQRGDYQYQLDMTAHVVKGLTHHGPLQVQHEGLLCLPPPPIVVVATPFSSPSTILSPPSLRRLTREHIRRHQHYH
jgi:hypothetical protein